MKKRLTLGLAIILVVALAGGLFYAFGADKTPEVIFDAEAKTFSFENVVYGADSSPEPTTESPYPDLFQIRSAMPGDSEDWQVKVTVKNAGRNTVKMYVRAENANDDYKTLFGEEAAGPATLTAEFTEGDRSVATKIRSLLTGDDVDKTSYTGYVDEGGAYLGAYTGREPSKDIDLTFAIPLEAGNEIANLTAEVDWVFVAEIIEPVTPPPGPGPELNTEDHFGYIIGYPDKTIRPENNITRAETATILFRLLTDESRTRYWSTSNNFSDVPSTSWFNAAVSTLSNAGIINGYPDGTFRPDEPVTRAEYAVMFSRFFDVIDSEGVSFSDIEGHWAKQWILSSASRGFINGYPDGTFRPDNKITRAEAMTLTNRVLGRRPDKDHLHKDMVVWSDNSDPNVWYYADVQEASNSHEFVMQNAGTDNAYEEWQAITATRDWAALEKQWSSENANKTAAVYTSKP